MARSLTSGLLLLGLCGWLVSGCEDDLRVPYIAPTLANWPQPYRGVSGIKVHVFTTGRLRAPEALVERGGSITRTRELPVPVFLIEHPTQGLILFNTGLSPKRATAPPAFLAWVKSLLQPEALPDAGLRHEMEEAGFKADAVRWLVLSDMRFDHTGEAEQFPNARVVVSKTEHEYAQTAPSGYVASHFDAVANWHFLEFAHAPPLGTFPAHVDLFGDGSCLVIAAAGFTPGSVAMLVRLARRPLLLADDVAPTAESLRYAAEPAWAYDQREWWLNIWRLKRFEDLVPDLIVLPGHDLDAARAAASEAIVVHERGGPERGAGPARPGKGAPAEFVGQSTQEPS